MGYYAKDFPAIAAIFGQGSSKQYFSQVCIQSLQYLLIRRLKYEVFMDDRHLVKEKANKMVFGNFILKNVIREKVSHKWHMTFLRRDIMINKH